MFRVYLISQQDKYALSLRKYSALNTEKDLSNDYGLELQHVMAGLV